MNKGKRVCAVSGRSIASLHITWCKGLSITRRGMSQRLFSRCMIYRVVGLPDYAYAGSKGLLIMLYNERHCEARRHLFSATTVNPEGRFCVALSKKSTVTSSRYQRDGMLAMYSSIAHDVTSFVSIFFALLRKCHIALIWHPHIYDVRSSCFIHSQAFTKTYTPNNSAYSKK